MANESKANNNPFSDGSNAEPRRIVIIDEISQKTIIDQATASLKYTGNTKNINTGTDEAKWRIIEEKTVGSTTTTRILGKTKFDQIFDNRVALFNAIDGDGVAAFTNSASLQFDGVDEYLNTDSFAISGGGVRSFSCWVKFSSGTPCFFSYGKASGLADWNFTWDGTKIVLFLNGSNVKWTVPATIADGSWHHIVITMPENGKTEDLKCYLDNNALSVGSSTAPTSVINTGTSVNFQIGRYFGGTNYMNGNIDEVSIWTTELTPTEVTELYNSGVPSDLNEHSQVINLYNWWRMGDGTGDTFPSIKDQTTREEHGSMVNMESTDIVADVPS